ncbi:MAG: ABC transporter permease subunit [Planctomycetia bacterium]|nr:ABC transporter permease subunit [Planctomycetia bacterium]
MNRALWGKTIAESRRLFLACAALLLVFNALFVWLTSLIDLGMLKFFLQFGIKLNIQGLLPVPIESMATPEGMIAVAYAHPLVLFTMTVWAIARGSDAVSGEVDRGTMEFLLAQPIRRSSIVAVAAIVTSAGAVLLGLACWLGTWLGIHLVKAEANASSFLLPAVNLASLAVFLGGLATFVSAFQRYRWRAIGWMGGIYAVELILKVAAQMLKSSGEETAHFGDWLMFTTFFGAYEPERFVQWQPLMAVEFNGVLLGMGAAAYVGAGIVFCRRDLPAPL